MKKFLLVALGIAILGLFVFTIYFLYTKSKPKTVIYKTEKPFISDIIKKTVATGSIIPRKEINLKPIVSGIIEKIYVEPGMYVKSGEIIAKIKLNPNLSNLNSAENQLTKAKLSFEQAKLDFERNKKLFQEKVIAFVDYNNALVTFEKAKDDLLTAENQISIIKEGSNKQSGRQSNLVKASSAGMILDIPVKEGYSVIESNTFNDGTTIAVLADMNKMIFEGKIDESEVGKIKKGMEIELTVGAIDNKKYKANLEFIAPQGVTEDGAVKFTIRAVINLDKKDFLRAGYSASADIILDKKEKVLAVNEGVLQFGKDSVYVEVETSKTQVFLKKIIKTGLSDGSIIEVKNGLNLKDRIKIIIKEAVPVANQGFNKK
jgi:HlyD family secretion protein